MNKLYLLRKAAIIHAVKCKNANTDEQAVASMQILGELNSEIVKATDKNFLNVTEEVKRWAAKTPIATKREIQELFIK